MKWPNILKASHGLTDGLFIHCYVCRVRVVYKNISVCRAAGMYGNVGGLVFIFGGQISKPYSNQGWGQILLNTYTVRAVHKNISVCRAVGTVGARRAITYFPRFWPKTEAKTFSIKRPPRFSDIPTALCMSMPGSSRDL